jgi:ABC-type molybdate transport system permease subunit
MKTAIHHKAEPPISAAELNRKAAEIAIYARRIIGPNKPNLLRKAMGFALATVLADHINEDRVSVKTVRESLALLGDKIEEAAAILGARKIAERGKTEQ